MWSLNWPRRASRRSRPVLPSPLIDPVTGAGTRQGMRTALEALVSAQRPGALALLEVDAFEVSRLRRGDEHANWMLRRVVATLAAIEGATPFRIDGGRFAVVLWSAGDLTSWAADVSTELARAVPSDTISIGTARAERGVPAATVEERAAQALRVAQRRGRGSLWDFGAETEDAPVGITPDKARALSDLLSDGYLRVHYQPIIDLRDGRTVAFEALARPQATHGLAGPQEAFDIATRLGLIAELDAVCRASVFTDGPGFDMPRDTRLHVNISPLSLGHRSLTTAVLMRQLKGAGLEPRRVVFELTEAHASDPDVTDRELRRLSEAGFTVMLDDVGARSAGLTRLMSGAFDGLKIANDVVAAAPTSPHAVGVIEALCAFSRHTGTAVIAEGVEDASQLRFVQDFRPDGHPEWRIPAAQGYVLGRPHPTAKVRTSAAAGAEEPTG